MIRLYWLCLAVLGCGVAVLLVSSNRTPAEPLSPPVSQARVPSAEFTVTVRETRGRWTISFDGRTNLPPRTLLRLTVYHPRKDGAPDFLFAGLTDLPLAPAQASFHALRVPKDGRIRADLWRLRRPPFPLPYVGRVQCRLEDQSEAEAAHLRSEFGVDRYFESVSHFSFGSAEELEPRLRESARLALEDLDRLQELYDALVAQYRERRGGASFEAFRNDWTRGLRRVEDRNFDRFALFRCAVERDAWLGIRELTQGLAVLVDRIEEAIQGGSPGTLAEIQRRRKEFEDASRQFHDAWGGGRVDPERLKGPVARLDAAARRAADLATTGDRMAWDAEKDAIEAEILAAGFATTEASLATTENVHALVTAVTEAFADLRERVAARIDPSEIAKSVGTLQAACRALREFTGQ